MAELIRTIEFQVRMDAITGVIISGAAMIVCIILLAFVIYMGCKMFKD